MTDGMRAALRWLLTWAIAGGGLLLLAIVGLPICPTRTLFGVPCPGCGMTRAMLALARGELETALRLHPLAPLILGFAVYAIAAAAWDRAVPRDRPRAPGIRAYALLVGLLVVVWAARLSGGLGGPSDPIDPARGLLTAPLLRP